MYSFRRPLWLLHKRYLILLNAELRDESSQTADLRNKKTRSVQCKGHRTVPDSGLLHRHDFPSPLSELFLLYTTRKVLSGKRCRQLYAQTTPWPLVRKRTIATGGTATCRQNLLPTFVDRGVSLGQCGGSPAVVNLSFLDRSSYFSFM
jgi:hypothetical protein